MLLRHQHRRGLDAVGGKDPGGGDRALGHDDAEVLAPGLLAQTGGYTGETKALDHSRFQRQVHQGSVSEGAFIRGASAAAQAAGRERRARGRFINAWKAPDALTCRGEGASLAVAALVFLARAAWTRIVAADLLGLAPRAAGRARSGSGRRAGRGLFGLSPVTHHDPLRALLLLELLHALFAHGLHGEDLLDHVGLHRAHQRLEHREAFLLIFDQRIELSVAAQADAFLEMVHREQMVLPQGIERLQHHDLFDLTHHRRRKLLLALLVERAHALSGDVDQVVRMIDRMPIGVLAKIEMEMELLVEGILDRLPVPLLGRRIVLDMRLDDLLDQRVAHVGDIVLERRAGEQFAAAMVNDLALTIHHVVVFEQMLADIEVVRLDLLLGVLDRFADPAMLDRDAVFHPDPAHQALELVGAENAQQVVLEREEKPRAARVALTSGTPAQLVVDAPRLVPLGAQDMQAAGLQHLLALGQALRAVLFDGGAELLVVGVARAGFGRGHELGIAAEHDVGAAARHVGRDGHRAEAPGLGDDLGLALVVLGIEHGMPDAGLLELIGHALGFLDRYRADQHRLPALVAVLDFLDNRVELLVLGFIHDVVVVDANHRLVGRHHDHVEAVNLLELGGLGVGGAGHPRQLVVHAEVVLEGDGRQRLVLGFDLDAFLGLDRLVQPVAPAPPRHQAAGELIHDHHLAVLDHVFDVALEQRVRLERLVDVMDEQDVTRVKEIPNTEQRFNPGHAFLGQRDGTQLLVNRVMVFGLQARDDAVDDVVGVGGFLGSARDDERRARLVDQNRIDLVDDREIVRALDVVLEVELHVVAQVIEAKLVVLTVSDVAGVGGLAIGVAHAVHDHADAQPQEAVDAAHP